MNTEERIRRCRIIEKMEEKDEYARRLGMENCSIYKGNRIQYKYLKRRRKEL